MEIVYSQTGKNFDHFFDSYNFLLEERTLTSFTFSDAQVNRLYRLYEVLVSRGMEPVLFLSACFNKTALPRPADLDAMLSKITRFSHLSYPIEKFKFEIEATIGTLQWWTEPSRISYYTSAFDHPQDPRLLVVDPQMRLWLSRNINPGFERNYWTRLLATYTMIASAKLTLAILAEQWIPFVYGVKNEVSV